MGHRSEETAAAVSTRTEKKARKRAAKSDRASARRDKAAARRDKAAAKAGKAAAKAEKAAAKAGLTAATKPARLVTKLTDPKTAKRAVTIGKILAPALAPAIVKAATSTRGFLDARRARQLGVPIEEVGAFRGPTGPVGARITGLTDAIRELAGRAGNDLQVTRFTEVASARLKDLTAAVQACASMPRAKRSDVLRSVGRELDGIDADLVEHLMAGSRR